MELKDVRDILIQEGKNPDDYTIRLLEQGYTIILKTPEEKARDELELKVSNLEQENLNLMLAITETYETMFEENTNLMLALTEVYELLMGGM